MEILKEDSYFSNNQDKFAEENDSSVIETKPKIGSADAINIPSDIIKVKQSSAKNYEPSSNESAGSKHSNIPNSLEEVPKPTNLVSQNSINRKRKYFGNQIMSMNLNDAKSSLLQDLRKDSTLEGKLVYFLDNIYSCR